MNTPNTAGMLSERNAGVARIGLGLTQGLALYALDQAGKHKVWPATEAALFNPLLLITAFIPILLLGGVGQMRWKPLLAWAALAAAVFAGLALHDVARLANTQDSHASASAPSVGLIVFGALTLFIAHHLVAAADQARKIIAPYPRYFELAWNAAIQVALAIMFTGVFWSILWLGAALLDLVGVHLLRKILEQTWFALPATCLAFATAVHATDVRASLVRNARALVLTLFSWLLPVMALLAATFLIVAPVTGLQTLWSTKATTPIVLSVAIVLTALINAAYQDGGETRARSLALRFASLAAGVSIAPLVLIAAYSTGLRIAQYGLTPERIVAFACIFIALVYAAGYLLNALPRFNAQRFFERTNVAAAFVVIGVFLALFSPVADPARIAVDDQVARLRSGRIAPDQFDFAFLRTEGARYGKAALAKLKTVKDGPNAAAIVTAALRAESENPAPVSGTPASTRMSNVTVFPKGRLLPDTFLRQDWDRANDPGRTATCLVDLNVRCEAYLLDFDGDGAEDVLVTVTSYSGPTPAPALNEIDVFQNRAKVWVRTGSFPSLCDEQMRAALREGRFKAQPRSHVELLIDGRPLVFADAHENSERCATR